MSNELIEVLHRVAEDTFEQLAYLFPVPEGLDESACDPESTAVRVHFSGPFEGELIMTLSSVLLPELARNMMGLDDAEPVEMDLQHDALRELINVICGNLLPEFAGLKAVFDLSPPELLTQGAPEELLAGRSPQARARLGLDEGAVELILFYQAPLQEAASQG
jgi:CheY-specific phosphatase CheX